MSTLKPNLKNETCVITYCDVFDERGKKIGKGFTIERQDARLIPVLMDNFGKELPYGAYTIRHYEKADLVVVSWVIQ